MGENLFERKNMKERNFEGTNFLRHWPRCTVFRNGRIIAKRCDLDPFDRANRYCRCTFLFSFKTDPWIVTNLARTNTISNCINLRRIFSSMEPIRSSFYETQAVLRFARVAKYIFLGGAVAAVSSFNETRSCGGRDAATRKTLSGHEVWLVNETK